MINVTISARNEEDLATLVQFLKTVEHLGVVGSTRTLSLWVDGDGAGQMHFDFGTTDVKDVKIPDVDSELKFYIGD